MYLLAPVHLLCIASCAVCDCRPREVDCRWVAATDLPNKGLLRGGDELLKCEAVKSELINYPGDVGTPRLLDSLVLAREGIETESPHRLKVCTDCFNDLRKNVMPRAALANGLWLGDLPDHLRNASRASAFLFFCGGLSLVCLKVVLRVFPALSSTCWSFLS